VYGGSSEEDMGCGRDSEVDWGRVSRRVRVWRKRRIPSRQRADFYGDWNGSQGVILGVGA
jgi:hypothetical protein